MPPHNSPTRSNNAANQDADSSTHLTSTTRLPIIRSDHQLSNDPSWRTLMDRAMEQVSDTARAVADFEERLESIDSAIQATNAPLVSTYRGWAPGSSDPDRPERVRAIRPLPRNTRPDNDTATRRYRTEQRMYGTSRVNESDRINQERERNEIARRWSTLASPVDTRSRLLPGQVISPADSRTRNERIQMLNERVRIFAETRRYGGPGINSMSQDNQSQSGAAWTTRYHRDHTEDVHRQDSALHFAEQHLTKAFEDSIILLNDLRTCPTNMDRAALIESDLSGILQGYYSPDVPSDLRMLNTKTILKPQPSSFLRPGARFSGQQTASSSSRMAEILRLTRLARTRPEEVSNATTARAAQPWTHGVVSAGSEEPMRDCWPVTVTITSVDYKEMTLTGTMEAFNVPNAKGTNLVPPGDPNVSSITTYLEGEIIDFNIHTLRTMNFRAESRDDANYWRKLEPFRNLRREEVTAGFVDMQWISDHISKEWIIMRWKEKCFISPSDSSSGLTISGFYYITMKRSNGKIEGLYHDPESCPYQRLNLTADKPTFPIYNLQ